MAAAVAVMMATPAAAVGFLNAIDEIGLNNDDYEILKNEAEALYTAADPKVGDEGIWSNPVTGAHGSVELIQFDGTCATMAHAIRTPKTRDIHRLNSRRCKADDGRWLIAPE